jgi:hypothetical protein
LEFLPGPGFKSVLNVLWDMLKTQKERFLSFTTKGLGNMSNLLGLARARF